MTDSIVWFGSTPQLEKQHNPTLSYSLSFLFHVAMGRQSLGNIGSCGLEGGFIFSIVVLEVFGASKVL